MVVVVSQRCDAVQEEVRGGVSHFLEKSLPSGTMGETGGVPRLRVATFNIRNGRGPDGRNIWWLRRSNTLRVIQSLEADVLALQEVRAGQLRWLRRRLAPEFEVVAAARDGGRRGEHLVLGVRRTTAVVTGSESRWFTDTPFRPSRHPESRSNRCLLAVHLALSEGTATVVNTHLDERSSTARADAVRRLATWSPTNAIIVGDFNCTIDDPALAPLLDGRWRDALADLPSSGAGVATHHSFTGRTDGTRIDHVFVPRESDVKSARIVHHNPPGPWASDHWPVLVEIDISDKG